MNVGSRSRFTSPACSLRATFVALVLLTGAKPALADASDKAAAEALFQQGKTLMAQQEYAKACEKFRGSQELDAGLGTLLHLADCYEKLGRTASAWATFEEAASVAASRGDTSRNGIAAARAAALKQKLSYIVLVADSPLPEGALVTRDGRPVPSAVWGTPVPADPGKLQVSVSAPGYETANLEVTVPAQAPAPIELTLPRLQPTTGTSSASAAEVDASPGVEASAAASNSDVLSPTPAATQSRSDQATWGLIVGGVGIVALGVSAVVTLTGYSSYSDSLEDCADGDESSCGVTGTAARRDAISDLDVATVFGVGGAVVLGTGVVLYATAPATPNGTEQAWSTRGLGVGYQGVW